MFLTKTVGNYVHLAPEHTYHQATGFKAIYFINKLSWATKHQEQKILIRGDTNILSGTFSKFKTFTANALPASILR